MRTGGIDFFFDSLRDQRFTDFELVLVDGIYKHRAELVAEEARNRFLRVVHVEPQPNPFPVASFCAYANAGLVHASGEIAVFMVDYSRLPVDSLAKHAEFHRTHDERAGYMAPHRYIHFEPHVGFLPYDRGEIDDYADDIRRGDLNAFMISNGAPADRPAARFEVDGKTIAEANADPKLSMPAGAIAPAFFHAKNESCRLARAIEINGWDESLDGSHGWQDSDFSDRLSVKAGVRWELDPSNIVEIANPRGLFPFAKRLRDFRTNEGIWFESRAKGYPTPNKWNLRERHEAIHILPEPDHDRRPIVIQQVDYSARDVEFTEKRNPVRSRKIAFVYGEFSTGFRPNGLDVDGLYTREGLTGSESSFFNLARTLSERGHEVVAFVKCETPFVHASGLNILPIGAIRQLPSLPVEIVIAWNEPDYLQFAPAGARRICDQQLNDFGYCRNPNWKSLVDVWVSPSQHHADNVMRADGLTARVIPNSVDLDLIQEGMAAEQMEAAGLPKTGMSHPPAYVTAAIARHPHRVIYCSSPDRGLHHLLGMWPLIRKRIPDAELKVFYRLKPWLDRARGNDDESGRRARYIEAAIPRLADFGVTICDSVPNVEMMRELQAAAVLAYPCDPVRYTEGFGCSVLDAAAAGCLPLISDADALPSVHGAAAGVIAGKPGERRDVWVDRICWVLENPNDPEIVRCREEMQKHALRHSREEVTDMWEELISAEAVKRAVAEVKAVSEARAMVRP